jgi:hypothetical protein
MRALVTALTLLLAVLPAAAEVSPHADERTRAIKALSEQEVADLLAGRGMGLAKAAELNRYPGPMHVLELHERLGLTPLQAQAVAEVFGRMRQQAQALGVALVEREAELDRLFAETRIDAELLAAETAAIAGLQGELRRVHLAAHLATRALLTPEQLDRYDAARGYRGPAPGRGHGHGRPPH